MAAWRRHRISKRPTAIDSLLPIHLQRPAPTRIAWPTSKPSHLRSIRHISNAKQQTMTLSRSGRVPKHWRSSTRSTRHSRPGPRFEITNSRRIIYWPFWAIRGEDNDICPAVCGMASAPRSPLLFRRQPSPNRAQINHILAKRQSYGLSHTMGRQILHPDSRSLHGRSLGRILAQRSFEHDRFFAQHAILAHRETGNGDHLLADPA